MRHRNYLKACKRYENRHVWKENRFTCSLKSFFLHRTVGDFTWPSGGTRTLQNCDFLLDQFILSDITDFTHTLCLPFNESFFFLLELFKRSALVFAIVSSLEAKLSLLMKRVMLYVKTEYYYQINARA